MGHRINWNHPGDDSWGLYETTTKPLGGNQELRVHGALGCVKRVRPFRYRWEHFWSDRFGYTTSLVDAKAAAEAACGVKSAGAFEPLSV